EAVPIGVVLNAAEALPELARRGVVPDLLTAQTSAHDPLNGYIPAQLNLEAAAELRARDEKEYVRRARASMAEQVRAMLELRRRGAHVFDYGNNLRAEAQEGGAADAFAYPGFVPAYIRPRLQRPGPLGPGEGADRDRPRSPRLRLGRLAQSRDRGDEGRLGRDRGLAHPQRPGERRERSIVGLLPPRRWRGHRVFLACGTGHRRRRDGRRGPPAGARPDRRSRDGRPAP